MSDKVIQMQTGVRAERGWLETLVQAIKDWNVRRAAKAELQALPAHLLNDIGVSRELIDQYVDGTISRRPASVANVVELERKTAATTERKAA